MAIHLTIEELQTSWKKVSANKGIAGVDGVTIQTFATHLDTNLNTLLSAWNHGNYAPSPYRPLTIQPNEKKTRQLAIPTVADRIIHTAIAQKLVAKFEPEFEHISYGYRPNRSYTHAIRHIEQLRNQGYLYVLDADIKGYFDHICHKRLKQILQKYLEDNWVESIMTLLLSQQMPAQTLLFGVELGRGIPQGSPLSPLLANLYLDGFDEALLDRGEQIVRYADDFVVLVTQEQQAQHCLAFVTQYLASLKLQLNTEKTRVVRFQDGFTFLGVSFLDNMVLPLKTHTEKALVNIGKHELEMADDEALNLHSEEDEALNQTLWHSNLPPALRSLQAAIYDDDNVLPIEPDQARIERL